MTGKSPLTKSQSKVFLRALQKHRSRHCADETYRPATRLRLWGVTLAATILSESDFHLGNFGLDARSRSHPHHLPLTRRGHQTLTADRLRKIDDIVMIIEEWKADQQVA